MMEKSSRNALFVIALVFLCSVNTFAWDEVGHKLTAYIAWQRLTPEVRERVFKILMSAPEDSDLNTPYDAYNTRSDAVKKLELFMYASKWPDTVKDRSFEVRNKKYNQGNWHYGDIYWKQENGSASRIADFPVPSGLAVSKLAEFEKILGDGSYKDEEKSLALAWFLHVGGDLHNPLHNASRVTKQEPEGDQGGNRFVLAARTPTSFGVNLHSYWDGIIRRVKPRKNDAWDTDYLRPIAKKMIRKYKYNKMKDRLKLSDYKGWNDEGYSLLNEVVYTDELSRGRMPSKKYRKRAYKTAAEQITLAGYRLGETLNSIFGKQEIAKSKCRVIRSVMYPVTKRNLPGKKPRIALLDICPPNRGKVARPTTGVKVDGELIYYEFDIVRLFAGISEAKTFARKNKIFDAQYQ